jgi:hypothetical protein
MLLFVPCDEILEEILAMRRIDEQAVLVTRGPNDRRLATQLR